MKARMITAIIALIVSTLAVAIMSSSFLLNYKAEAQRRFATRVLVGGGNYIYPFYGYDPQRVEIKAGSTVVWSVPSMAPLEPHTVSFLFSNKTFAMPTTPFAIPSSTKLVP